MGFTEKFQAAIHCVLKSALGLQALALAVFQIPYAAIGRNPPETSASSTSESF
jgi:hypothetical protein